MNKRLVLIATLLVSLGIWGCVQLAYKFGVKPCAPVYGNWCGENYPLTRNDPDEVDDWDSACRTHDKCYESNSDKRSCNLRFSRELERLSRTRLAPQAMANAHSWFTEDGQVFAFVSIGTEAWAAGAACEGGDGRIARFYCQTNFGTCWLSASVGPGQQGQYRCHCGGVPGRIGED